MTAVCPTPGRSIDADAIDVLLCDADGTLFDSEGPAFATSTSVTNELLVALGIRRQFTPQALRRWATGRTFRSTAGALAADAGVAVEPDLLERWVMTERTAVTAELATVLRPSAAVRGALEALSSRMRLAVVTSSASTRLDACLTATALDDLFPAQVRFSAEDSLASPTSKPDPAIYRLAGEQLGVLGARGLAVEDSVAGVQSAVAAGFPTVGMLAFVTRDELAERAVALRDAGAEAIFASWDALGRALRGRIRGEFSV
jgi:HAD superfamily hydrolase (TIGR01509 family)